MSTAGVLMSWGLSEFEPFVLPDKEKHQIFILRFASGGRFAA